MTGSPHPPLRGTSAVAPYDSFMSAFRPAPLKPLVNFSALQALDLRVGEILAAEKVSASSKLVRLTVSFGDHTRTILAGLQKERENLQALVGWQTLFVI